MEEGKARKFQVEFTASAKFHFFENLEYFYENYTQDRAEQLANELEEMAQSLKLLPHRGTYEKWLFDAKYVYRFILFRRTKRADIKIIYYIDDETDKVFVTDFFPTESDGEKMPDRNL